MNNVSKSMDSSQPAAWRRYWIPLSIAALTGAFELVNWTTNLTAEKIMPTFASSAQTVLGRNVFLLALAAILFWLLVTRQVTWKSKGIVFGAVLLGIGALVACIGSIENTGNNNYVIRFRWQKTQDQRLAEFQKSTTALKAEAVELDPNGPVFTDFLGPSRNGLVAGPALVGDLVASPPEEIWRRPVGRSYSSCVLSGGLAVTIEQRGEEEVVVALDLATGQDRWTRGYEGHFKEDLGGNGPRATPTIAGNEVFALGANGLLVALDLASGAEKWKTNILTDAQADNITWGMSGSPLVISDKVIVNPGGNKGTSLAAYDRATGAKVWCAGQSKAGYSSPVVARLHDTDQAVIFDAEGIAGHDLSDGKELWRFPFTTFNGINVCQPIVLPSNRLFVSAGYDAGAVLVQVNKSESGWTTEEVWKTKQMKCKMGSCVYYDGHIYGLDDGILACIDANTGNRKWKGGRYGHGQFLLRNDILVIQAESGELALVAADPTKHRELAKISMLSAGKTWNAPALAGNLLLLRNHFEAVLLKMPTQP
jgi:outer membrane protein assembly factor BamB